MQKRLVVFKTKYFTPVYIQKDFKDDAHENNYINYMCKLKDWEINEIYEL